MEEVAEGHARQVFAGFEHAEAVTAEGVRRDGATDLGSANRKILTSSPSRFANDPARRRAL